MRILHDELEKQLPRQALRNVLNTKLTAQGIELSDSHLESLADQILSGEEEPTLPLDAQPSREGGHVKIDCTQQDLDALESIYERIPELVDGLSEDLAPAVLERLVEDWPNQHDYEQGASRAVQESITQRWEPALKHFGMLLAVARELCTAVSEEIGSSEQFRPDVLIRLQARACQIAEEVRTLILAGFADGAMARWRTLHEVAVVALLIGDHGEDLAERYVLHEHIDSRRAALRYEEYRERLGYEPYPPDELEELDRIREELIDRFDKRFAKPNGWAAGVLGTGPKDRILFSDIEETVGIDHFRPHYKLASHSVHANPKGLFFKLGLLGERGTILTGPSDAGLADPLQSTAISLNQASAPLGLIGPPTLDHVVALRIMGLLVDRILAAVDDATAGDEQQEG